MNCSIQTRRWFFAVTLLAALAAFALLALSASALAGSNIHGTVTDAETERPIDGASVYLMGEENEYQTETDRSGEYSIDCNAGKYELSIEADGYKGHKDSVILEEDEEKEYNAELEKEDPSNSRVYGNVKDAESGGSISEATVDLKNKDHSYSTTTDDSGNYEIQCAAGDYDVNIRKDGYKDHYGQVSVEEDDEVEYNAELEKEAAEDSKVYGQVTDKDTGDPLGANVYLEGEKSYQTYTDRSGNYEIQCAADDYRVTVTSDGYKTHYGEVSVGEGEEIQYDVQLEKEDPPDSQIHGNVTDVDTGEPIGGATVRLENADYKYNTETSKSGDYQIDCHSGDYEITISASGYKTHYGEVTVKPGNDNVYDAALEPAEENSKVYGYVTDADSGEAIDMADVYLRNSDNSYSTRTDREGYYEIQCASGEYDVSISKEGYKTHYGQVKVADDEEVRYDAALDKDGTQTYLEGYVTDAETEDPIEEARVTLKGNSEYQTYTDKEGYYRISCEPGDYDMLTEHPDYEDDSRQVTVKEGANREDVVLEPTPMAKVHGYVRDAETNDPIKDAQVRFRDQDSGATTTVESDGEGWYSVELSPGDYDIYVSKEDYEDLEDEISLEDDDDEERDFELTPEIKTGEVWGTVKDNSNSENIQGVTLTFIDKETEDQFDTSTDEYGDYSIELVEGDYDIAIEHEDFQTKDDEVTVVGDGDSERNYRLDPNESLLSGEVLDRDSEEGVKDASVTATAKESRGGEPYTKTVESDSDGSYEMNLPAGDYQIEIEHEDYLKFWDNITMEKGEDNEQDFELELRERVGTVTGRVIETGTGTPLEGASVAFTTTTRADYTATTDEYGDYEISLPEGEYDISVELENYDIVSDSITVEDKEEYERDYELEKLPDKSLDIISDAPVSLLSEDDVYITVTITEASRAGEVEDVKLTLSVTGPATLSRTTGTTDSSGEFSFRITVDAVDADNTVVINITAEHAEYRTNTLELEIAIISEPPVEELDPVEGDLPDGASYSITAGVTGDGELEVYATTSPDPEDDKNLGLFLDIEFDGEDEDLKWVYIVIYYNEIPNGLTASKLKIYYWDDDGEDWVEAQDTGVDTVNQFVWANVTHLTLFGPRDVTGAVEKNYGVTLTGTAEQTVKAGEEARFFLNIENTGDEDDSFTIELAGSKPEWGSLEFDDLDLVAGEDKDLDVTVTIPAEIPAGTYTLKVTATSQGDTGTEDSFTITVTVESEAGEADDSPGFAMGFLLVSFLAVAVVRKRF